MKFFTILLCSLFLTSCGPASCISTPRLPQEVKEIVSIKGKPAVNSAPMTTIEIHESHEQKAVREAQDTVSDLKGQLAKAQEELTQKETILQRSRYDSIRKLSFWLSGISVLAMCGAVAAAIFLPVFRKQLIMGAIACLSVMVLSMTVEAALDYIKWIGVGIMFAGMAALVWWLIKSRKAIAKFQKKLAEHAKYILEFGKDMEEIEGWRWGE